MKIGIIGTGQLGRILALAGYPLGFEFSFLGKEKTDPTKNLGDFFAENDPQQLKKFIDSVDVVTFESENTSLSIIEKISSQKPVYPGIESLRITQNRIFEKQMMNQLGIATAAYEIVTDITSLNFATEKLGLPGILKTTTQGYDGKGQYVLKQESDIETAWQTLQGNELIYESFVNFQREVSLIAVRSKKGDIQFYPLTETRHKNGILQTTITPAPNCESISYQAQTYVKKLLEQLNHVGMFTLEMFVTDSGLLANEMAPRVHNSGHWSIEGAVASQFENHVRAIANLPLGTTTLNFPYSGMINLIGHLPSDINSILKEKNTHLHLYNKTPRPGRKLGHITVTANSLENLQDNIERWATCCPPFYS